MLGPHTPNPPEFTSYMVYSDVYWNNIPLPWGHCFLGKGQALEEGKDGDMRHIDNIDILFFGLMSYIILEQSSSWESKGTYAHPSPMKIGITNQRPLTMRLIKHNFLGGNWWREWYLVWASIPQKVEHVEQKLHKIQDKHAQRSWKLIKIQRKKLFTDKGSSVWKAKNSTVIVSRRLMQQKNLAEFKGSCSGRHDWRGRIPWM